MHAFGPHVHRLEAYEHTLPRAKPDISRCRGKGLSLECRSQE